MKNHLFHQCLAFLCFIIVISGILAFSCSDKGANPVESTSASTLSDLHAVQASMSNWTEDTTLYTVFVDSTLHILINGEDIRYIENHTLVAGYRTSLFDSVTQHELGYYVMDFGTPANATAIFNKIVDMPIEVFSKYDLPGFTAAIAVGNESGTGNITGYAHFNKFFFKLGVAGYSSSQLAASEVSSLLTKFKSAIK